MAKEDFIIPKIFGQEIGVILEGRNGVEFQYFETFDAGRYDISPLKLPFDPSRTFNFYDAMVFKGLPGVFHDSLPDSFGHAMMEEFFRQRGKVSSQLTLLDRLSYVGPNGIGAIEYHPDLLNTSGQEMMDLRAYVQSARAIISGSQEDVIVQLGAHPSPGGARPKAAILWDRENGIMSAGDTCSSCVDSEAWIVKFDESGSEMTRIEEAYMTIADQCGIRVSQHQLLQDGDDLHFATKRFDRIGDKKRHQITLAGLTHKDFMEQNTLSYELYLRYSHKLTGDHAVLREAFERMLFNVIGRNCDDHIKNFSFSMDESGKWGLSPAYDLVHSSGPALYGEHKMSINGKNSNILLEDLAQCGYDSGLQKTDMIESIQRISDAFSSLGTSLKDAGVSKEHSAEILQEVNGFNTSSFPEKMKRKRIRRSTTTDALARKILKP